MESSARRRGKTCGNGLSRSVFGGTRRNREREDARARART